MSSARALKSPLGMRPVYHQKTDRVDAHIFACFLALHLRLPNRPKEIQNVVPTLKVQKC